MNTQPQERNQEATVYVGNLDDKVTEELVWELFLQAGPVVNVHMPKDRVTGFTQGFCFVEFLGEEDAEYAIKIMQMIKLYGKPMRVNKASSNLKSLDVGANIYVGNLAPEVDEKLIYDTFSAFGVILQHPKIMRDPHTGASKGFAFVNYASFDSSDAAIQAMHGQFLCNRAISVTYAYKKDGQGERHGSAAERLLAAQAPAIKEAMPHQLFADSARDPAAAPPMHAPHVAPHMAAPVGIPPHMRLPVQMHPGGMPPVPHGLPPAGAPPHQHGHFPPPHQHGHFPPPHQQPPQHFPPHQHFPPQNFAPPGFHGGMPPHAQHGGFPGQPPMPQGPPPQMMHAQPPMPQGPPPMMHAQPPMPQGPPPMPQGPPPMMQGPPPQMMQGQPPMPQGPPPMPQGPPPMMQGQPPVDLSGEEAYQRRLRMSQQPFA